MRGESSRSAAASPPPWSTALASSSEATSSRLSSSRPVMPSERAKCRIRCRAMRAAAVRRGQVELQGALAEIAKIAEIAGIGGLLALAAHRAGSR